MFTVHYTGSGKSIALSGLLNAEWTIPQLHKLLNLKTILAQLEDLPKFSEIVKFGCKVL